MGDGTEVVLVGETQFLLEFCRVGIHLLVGGEGVLHPKEEVGGGGALHDFLVGFEHFDNFERLVLDHLGFGATHLTINAKIIMRINFI